MNSIAHLEINVSHLEKSKNFYLTFLSQLKWKMVLNNDKEVGFKGPDNVHLFLKQTENSFLSDVFHRKQTGLNHIAFRVESEQEIEDMRSFLKENNIKRLYENHSGDYSEEYHMKHYKAVFFEDPDRIKCEIVFVG